jgi:hypothetical protein
MISTDYEFGLSSSTTNTGVPRESHVSLLGSPRIQCLNYQFAGVIG